MRDLSINEFEVIYGGKGTDPAGEAASKEIVEKIFRRIGYLGAIDFALEFALGFAEAIEDVNE